MNKSPDKLTYCRSFFENLPFKTRSVPIGNINVGGINPIRIQSMTTAGTMETEKSIKECIELVEAGCEIVRLTAPSKKEAENLKVIKDALRSKNITVPLVADIHFTPNAAEVAANIVEKVRINPGNYADKKKFDEHIYTDESYLSELLRIEEKFTPLVLQCKKNNVAMRIGTNHGSLSDRILSRYGDTPTGMVESAMEFLRICIKNDYHAIVLSMKASNTLVMVEAYRLLVLQMKENNMDYPLHLGVTEAGDGEDGRIKSAVGIGALLEDGIGDTIRVSLTEDSRHEIPVAQKLLEKFNPSEQNLFRFNGNDLKIPYEPFSYRRRETGSLLNIGGGNVPVVVGSLSHQEEIKPAHLFGLGYRYSVQDDKWHITDTAVDYIYLGNKKINFPIPEHLVLLLDYQNWVENKNNYKNSVPFVNQKTLTDLPKGTVCFVSHAAEDFNLAYLKNRPDAIVVLGTSYSNKTHLYRAIYSRLAELHLKNPVILCDKPKTNDNETFQVWSSSSLGSLFLDGFGDGIWLSGDFPLQLKTSTSFGILQATRVRISKTEYISCPSCGRTLFDLQETTAKIRNETSHLKGLKIGIMGCIVNGPGEMADADYGYVGTGIGKIHLYKEKVVVRKNIPDTEAVEALINLIKENGDWVEKPT